MNVIGEIPMKLKLVKFKKSESRFRGSPYVKVTDKGFRFNQSSYEKYLKDKPFVELYWDEENKVIGIQPLNKETDDSLPVRIYRKTQSPVILINSKRFIEDCGIMGIQKENRSYQIEEGEEGILLIKLGAVE